MKFVKMGGKKKNIGRRAFVGIEPRLEEARKQKLLGDKLETHQNRIIAEQIYEKLIAAMKKQSPLFASLYVKKFGGGSSYEGLKVGKGNEFDIDVLLKIPKITKPVLKEDTILGFVQLQLENFENLKVESPALYSEMKHFVDDQNYLLTMDMKSAFVQSIFDKTLQIYFPDKTVKIGQREYKILKIQTLGPAFTLSVEGQDFCGSIDLVPCILLTKDYWPKVGFKSNPYASPSEFFIVPKQPKRTHPHLNRYWRLSFQMQERVIIFNRLWMKPTIRIMKRIRDHFNQHTSSYALKTIFMWELYQQNPALDACIPDLWKHCLSYCVVYMLEKYLKCLEDRTVPYFWNSKLNLLDNLTDQQIDHYKGDIERMIKDVKANPLTEVILKYLE